MNGIDLAADPGPDLVYVLGLDQPARIERAVRTAHSRRGRLIPAARGRARFCIARYLLINLDQEALAPSG